MRPRDGVRADDDGVWVTKNGEDVVNICHCPWCGKRIELERVPTICHCHRFHRPDIESDESFQCFEENDPESMVKEDKTPSSQFDADNHFCSSPELRSLECEFLDDLELLKQFVGFFVRNNKE